jgi:hypothetical protein
MNRIALTAVLVCSLASIANTAQANNASFGFGVSAQVAVTDNRAQPWLGNQKTMSKKGHQAPAAHDEMSAFYTSLQYKVKSLIKKMSSDKTTK